MHLWATPREECVHLHFVPAHLSSSVITSKWFKGKKHACQESTKNFRVTSHCCSHRVDIPQGQFDLSCHAAPSTTQHPPGLAHLPLHCLHWCSWCWEISRCWGISQHSPERDPTGGAGTGHGWFWFGVNGNRRTRPRGEQGGGVGPGNDETGWGSHGDPSSSPGQCGAPLPVLLLGRVVQLVVGDQSIRRRFVPAFAFRPATCPMAFLAARHLLVREALVL